VKYLFKRNNKYEFRAKTLTTKIRTPKLPLSSVGVKDSFGVTITSLPFTSASKNPTRSVNKIQFKNV